MIVHRIPLIRLDRMRVTHARRTIASILLVVIAVGITGLPLTAPKRLAEQRFPCESCPCGCVSAEFCWDRCCCHSDQEKLRWASENGVDPPKFLIQRVAAETPSTACATRGCCGCGSAPANVDEPVEETCPVNDGGAEAVAVASSSRTIQWQKVAACRGVQLVWTMLSMVIIDPREPVATPLPRLLYRLPVEDQRAETPRWCPDPPVP